MNIPPTSTVVGSPYAGWRLDRFAVAILPSLSRTCVQSLIHSGCVRLRGRTARPSEKVRTGDILFVCRPVAVASTSLVPEPTMPLHVLYEDTDLLVVNKEAGVVVHPGSGNWKGTLAGAILARCRNLSKVSGAERPGIVHRLDKGTSGCLVVAKNDATHCSLSREFALRKVKKTYLAIVQGVCTRTDGTICAPICRHPIHRQRMSVAPLLKGRDAVTHYQVLSSARGTSLVVCFPQTGRTHQIRVHLKYLGHPVLGDAIYGERRSFPHHLLHAWKLSFFHPTKRVSMEFCAPIPTEMQLDAFQKFWMLQKTTPSKAFGPL
ncbi:Ribosomal large subunit pseudouridine synthase D [Candidatus Xiphinematobacter sp. Idaho Grape]|uniref:RluA family pseudouridine synthase n=1 Tax=Candidatus Xiphinematobacter sp. Idaho Grape TaxID=1704307 RepID=UPI00070578EC|nr:RluA family pseudouridine synthase [Candidatus Xiphinematobacter sp. Idaho Grape]ALJ56564.1 Ribosomal large subunit pseudouridine synthase D [Candidatus Xiphinematobacter sp. Idaho Grape]